MQILATPSDRTLLAKKISIEGIHTAHVEPMKSAIAIRVTMKVIYLAKTAAVSNLGICDLSRLGCKIVLQSKMRQKEGAD